MAEHRVEFKFISDPGHGWLEVDISDIHAVGLTSASFSRFSYRKHDTCYLEEDCDASRFIDAYQAKFNHSPHITNKHQENTPIRNYASLNGRAA